MRVSEYLDDAGVKYQVTTHRPTYTAQRMAEEEHESGQFVAKPVIVKINGKELAMCVLAAPTKINFEALKAQLGSDSVTLANENEISQAFPDCEVGAEPPFGNLYGMETFMDKSMLDDDHIVFQAGTHSESIRISMSDYLRLVSPKILEFSYQSVTWKSGEGEK